MAIFGNQDSVVNAINDTLDQKQKGKIAALVEFLAKDKRTLVIIDPNQQTQDRENFGDVAYYLLDTTPNRWLSISADKGGNIQYSNDPVPDGCHYVAIAKIGKDNQPVIQLNQNENTVGTQREDSRFVRGGRIYNATTFHSFTHQTENEDLVKKFIFFDGRFGLNGPGGAVDAEDALGIVGRGAYFSKNGEIFDKESKKITLTNKQVSQIIIQGALRESKEETGIEKLDRTTGIQVFINQDCTKRDCGVDELNNETICSVPIEVDHGKMNDEQLEKFLNKIQIKAVELNQGEERSPIFFVVPLSAIGYTEIPNANDLKNQKGKICINGGDPEVLCYGYDDEKPSREDRMIDGTLGATIFYKYTLSELKESTVVILI